MMEQSKAIALNRKIIQVTAVVGILLTIYIGFQIKQTDFFAINGPFQQLVKNAGFYGPLLFILVQIVQVVYPIIPGGLTCVAGHLIFGPLYGFIYNFVGIMIGSIMNFMLAKRFGKSLVQAFVSEATYQKYIAYLDDGKRFERFLVGAFILPGFPDDFLCMVAGLSKMSLKRFIVICLISKPVTLYLYTVIAIEGIQIVLKFFGI
ncbi:TVP38/TMEM64 family protein [Granulicatella sp. s8]|uniref:TVP38/TMEM64 family membrane protein n=2 Tax=Granulicatella seriolae TaxID=2967226 RepID=A0ABT1WNT9_9LACT|nr:TVP38/TMEM64 family protein [Granulicatella seriolae]